MDPPASPAQVVVLARRAADLGAIANDQAWHDLPGGTGRRVWSDSYVNVLSVLKLR